MTLREAMRVLASNPVHFVKFLWPDVTLYDKQKEILHSLWANDETYVPAANMMGKDFIAAYAILAFFLTRQPCRIVTTSVKDGHLDVLWGEIGRAIDTCRFPLDHKSGGPLKILQRKITKIVNGELDTISYVKGMVADDMNAMQGHHVAKTGDGIPRTMFVVDEAAGVQNDYYDMAATWADRMYIFGNCNPCSNFFFRGVKRGIVPDESNGHLLSNVIRIKAEDSPNVQLALAEKRQGLSISGRMLVPGVLGARDYFKRRKMWDKIRQCIGLDGEFYGGAESLLFPPEWLNNAEQKALTTNPLKGRNIALGIDTAFGGDSSVWAVVSDWGIEEIVSLKTPDTSMIVGKTIAIMRKHGIQAKNVLFDAGGGGAVHAHIMKKKGYKVQAIAFGASATPQKKRGFKVLEERKEDDIIRYAYKNRRAEMYGLLSRKLDPNDGGGMAINTKYTELRNQLSPIPRLTDGEGRLYLPSKKKKSAISKEETMADLIGRSPDDADAVVLAVFGLDKKINRAVAGAIR